MYFNGVQVNVVSFDKYLGVYFTPKLIWTKTQEIQAMQAVKAVARIFKYIKKDSDVLAHKIFSSYLTL